MQYQTLTAATYLDLVVRLISGFEGHEIQARDIGDKKATIGYGYTFNRSNNVAIWSAAGIILTSTELAALTAIDAAPAANQTALAIFTFTRSLSRTEAQELLKQTYPKYEAPAISLGMPLSAERAAFVSLTYNRGVGRANGMTEFAAAVNGSDRAEAWYQLRYNALGTTATTFRDGVAKRRFVEAQIFGLYDNPASPTDVEAKQIFGMLTKHRTDILKYESQYGVPPDGTSAVRNMIAVANGEANLSVITTTQSLYNALIPARDTFITWLNTQLPADRQIDASILNPAAIYYNGNTTAGAIAPIDASGDDGKGRGLGHNVMVGRDGTDILIGGADDDVLVGMAGSDVLEGGTGVDKLFGGTDNDIINGGRGDDILYGGAGEDLYIWNTGDGNDTIIDDDGGRLIINGQDYKFGGGTMIKDGTSNIWKDASGNVTLTHNSPWRIELSDGSVIQLGEGFDPTEWGINLIEKIDPTQTYNGDQRAELKDGYYNWGETSWAADGTLIKGVAEADFSDFIYGTLGNDKISGLGGNDALAGGAGNDQIDGGTGDDLIGGGLGSDNIKGGDGNDYISSNAGLTASQRSKPDDSWSPPAGMEIQTQGATWGIYINPADETMIWDGISSTFINNHDGDVVDGGAGDDWVIASWNDDRVQGGTDNDRLDGLAGADILEGGDGNDHIYGDGKIEQGYLNTVPAVSHGADFLDGGTGDDYIVGDGNDDQLFGGMDNDVLIGDSALMSNDASFVPLEYHGQDYLDGEDGDDELVGSGKEDILYGGAGNDNLWGDTSAQNLANESDNALMWADDYLDGESGNDYLEGGGKDDILYGGLDDDTLFGDEQSIALKAEFHGQDYLDGEEGNDSLEGGGKDDTLYGGAGNDNLLGDSNSAYLEGAAHGSDYLDGEDGDDNIAGNGGADTLYGGAGNDTVQGDISPLELATEFHGDDYVDGGNGNDILLGNGGNDTLYGGAGNNELQGGTGNDHLDGGADDDILFGEEGNDVLTGGDGLNYFLGGLGDDTLIGGSGNDFYYYNRGEGIDHITDAGGTDRVVFTDISSGQVTVGVGSLKISLPDGGELHLDDFDPENPLEGTIEYFQFSDKIMTRQELIQTLGFKITGTSGEDDLIGTALGDDIQAFAGDDYVASSGGNDSVDLGEGNDSADAGSGDDDVAGGGDSDNIHGGEGADMLDGGADSDDLYGDAGDDQLIGGLGDDYLAGGSGNDTLKGGDGNDVYLFGVGDGQDIVIDSLGSNAVLLTGGLTESQISLSQVGSDLIVAIPGTADRLTVKDWFTASDTGWTLALGDGTVFDRAAVQERLMRNGVPVLVSDAASAVEDGAIEISGNALANDADPEGRALRVTNAGTYNGSYGTLTINSAGAFNYTLNNASAAVQSLAAGQTVTDNFAYTATDDDPAGAASATSSIVISIQGTNDAPTVAFDFNDTTEDDVLTASGNVLANDHDVDTGTVLHVIQPGAFQGTYGELALEVDGSYVYTANNNSAAVQSLGRYQTATDQFSYTTTDGIRNVTSTLTVDVHGTNDAPIVALPLADQSASANASYQWQIPAGSFTDMDHGDTLFYSASLADGSALPAWLQFDAPSGLFSGRVLRDAAGYLDIQVTAIDKAINAAGLMVPSSQETTTHDTFRLTFESSKGGSGGGGTGAGGVGTQGNEGVGNGVDGPPPGHDNSFNDAPGTSPGKPGAQGGNGWGEVRPQISEISVSQMEGAVFQPSVLESGMSNHGGPKGKPGSQNASADAEKNVMSSAGQNVTGNVPDADTSATAAQNGNTANSNSTDPMESAPIGADVIRPPAFANPALLNPGTDTPAGREGNGASISYIARWKTVDDELVNHLASSDNATALGSTGQVHSNANAFLGSTVPALQDQLSLNGDSGMGLTTFQGLKEGLRKVA